MFFILKFYFLIDFLIITKKHNIAEALHRIMMIVILSPSPVLGLSNLVLSKTMLCSSLLVASTERALSVCVSMAPHSIQVKVLIPSESTDGSVVMRPSSQE